jgi:hypothetical protein
VNLSAADGLVTPLARRSRISSASEHRRMRFGREDFKAVMIRKEVRSQKTEVRMKEEVGA